MTTGPARALLRVGLFLDGFSACFSRRPQREAATQYIDGLFNDSERKLARRLPSPRSGGGTFMCATTTSPARVKRLSFFLEGS